MRDLYTGYAQLLLIIVEYTFLRSIITPLPHLLDFAVLLDTQTSEILDRVTTTILVTNNYRGKR